MKEIRLIQLKMENFKGMTFRFEPDGSDADIFGQNGKGKTTVADAYFWLLFGKDSLGRTDSGKAKFEIKNLDKDGNAASGLDHVVEGIFRVTGVPVTLKRVFREVWSTPRGKAQRILTGNTTVYHIDGVPAKENEYKSRVAEIFGDEDVLRLLTSPTAYPSLPWERRRSLLLDVCGDVSDSDVIASDTVLSPLTDHLTAYTVSKAPIDNLKKVVTSRKAEIRKKIDELPIRIDENNKGLPDVTGLDRAATNEEVARLDAAVAAAKLRLQGIDNGAGIAELSKTLSILQNGIAGLQNRYYLEGMKHVTALNQQINEVVPKRESEERIVKGLKDELAEKQARIATLETQLEKLRGEWTSADSERFEDTTEDTCPACGQPLPADRVEQARTKALAAFNHDKAERLLKIETRGKGLRAELDRTKEQVEELNTKLAERPVVEDDLDALTAERDALKAQAEDYTKIPGRAEMLEQKADIEKQIQAAKDGVSQDKEAAQKEVNELETQLKAAKAIADRFTLREEGKARIEDLKAEERKLAKEFEEMEKQLYLIELFTRRKASLMDERINARFQIVHFKLFNELISGGIEDCCEITVNGVPYGGGLNNAARMQGGCEIITVLQEHYGIAPVMWLDNRESVTEIPEMKCQIISLYVSPEDKELRVEKANSKRVAA